MKKYYLLLPLLLLVLTGVGCVQFSSSKTEGTGGVWKTVLRGEKWAQQSLWLTAAGSKSIGGENIRLFAVDPEDHLAIYAGTETGGMFYSYDGGASWSQAKAISTGRVRDISVDAKDKCTIYVAAGQRVWKSTDCNRTFQSSYHETRTDVIMNQIEVDWFDSSILYAGTSSGDFLKSMDAGVSWAPMKRFQDLIRKIYIDPFDSRVVYVGLRDRGLWKSADGGTTWTDLSEGLKAFDRGRDIKEITADRVTRGLVIMASGYGILASTDSGATWEALNLLTPPSSVIIRSIAVNPKNGNEIYYGTDATFYKTVNGGEEWNTEKLPTKRSPTAMLVDPEDANVIYMGMTLFKEK